MKFIQNEDERDRANLLFQVAIAVVVLGMNVAVLIIISNTEIPPKNEAAFNIFLGNALGWVSALIAFAFPSSIGSAKKDDTIKKLADKAPPPTVPPEEITPKEMIDGRGAEAESSNTDRGDQVKDFGSGVDPEPIPAREDFDGDGIPDTPPDPENPTRLG